MTEKTRTKPQRSKVYLDCIPSELIALPWWVVWRYEYKEGKWTKVPYQANASGEKARSNDPATWGTFAQARAYYENDTSIDGIGIMFDGELCGMDLDKCLDNPKRKPKANEYIKRLNTYTEYSPSRNGVHCLCWAKLPDGGRKREWIEMYGKESARYFTITGDVLDGYHNLEHRRDEFAAIHAEVFKEKPRDTPKGTPGMCSLDDAELQRRMFAAKNGAKVLRLWNGDTSAHGNNDSDADLALCSHLAFWTQRDPDAMDRLFRQSGLYRQKWDDRHAGDGRTYGQMTIDKAIEDTTEVWTPSNGRPTPQAGEAEAKRPRGRPRKYKLLTADYMELYRGWEYDARLNLANNDIEVNGDLLEDPIKDKIQASVRDYGTINDVSVTVAHALESLTVMALNQSYHPIKSYLEGLQWDGEDHIENLTDYFTDPKGLFPGWFRHWLIGSVAKVYERYQNPMLVIDAEQDSGKSFFAHWLCPVDGWYLESAIYPENKDCKIQLVRSWIWEVSELGTTTRKADVEALKAFQTLQFVRVRKPYDRFEINKPALASFIGTVNDEAGFLVDRTGNRRFLACTVTAIDWDYAEKIDVNQLWAQAYNAYCAGDDWRLTAKEKQLRDAQNEAYMVADPIEIYTEKLYEITSDVNDTVATHAILSDLEIYGIKPSKWNTMALAGVLKKLGAIKDGRIKDSDGAWVAGYKGIKRIVKPGKADAEHQSGEQIAREMAF